MSALAPGRHRAVGCGAVTETEAEGGTSEAPGWRVRRRRYRIAVAVLAAATVASVAWAIGASRRGGSSSACSQRKALETSVTSTRPPGEIDPAFNAAFGALAIFADENPGCFTATERAQLQATYEELQAAVSRHG